MTTIQLSAVLEGQQQRLRLKSNIERAVSSELGISYPHTYIYSPPGLGKTYSVQKELGQFSVKNIEITGAQSMYAFGIHLATIKYLIPNEKVIIIVDDCDTIFKNEENINIMKNVLSGNRSFAYHKNIDSLINTLSGTQSEAVQSFRNETQLGFQVPTNNFVFIITSNIKLPTDEDVYGKGGKNNPTAKKTHLYAIRSRCNTVDFELTKYQHYGWIADVVLNEFDSLNDNIKNEIVDWLWKNWDNLNERSIRTVEKMIQIYELNLNSYKELWHMDFLKVDNRWI
jgi:hypothetical protein